MPMIPITTFWGGQRVCLLLFPSAEKLADSNPKERQTQEVYERLWKELGKEEMLPQWTTEPVTDIDK